MPSGLGLSSWGGRSATKDPMVDIERLLIDYAWKEIASPTCFDRLLRDRRYILEVNWGYLDISHRLTEFKIRRRDGGGGIGEEHKGKTKETEKLRSKVLQRDLCLFRTEFSNESNNEQTFTFKTERKTTSRCDVSLQRGFRVGANVDVRVSIPAPGQEEIAKLVADQKVELCRITGGLSGELHVTKTTGQTFEEVLTWGVDSQVKVEKKTRVEAQLLIREEELIADFTINSIIRPMQHVIPVYVKDKKTKRILALLEISSDNLSEVFKESEGFAELGENAVSCETKGSMRAIYGAEQIIRVKTMPLSETQRDDLHNSVGAILAC